MAFVSPEIQRQVQGLTTIRPEQKAVRSGAALTGALARVQGGRQVAGVARATQGQQRARGLSETRRNIKTARQDIRGANIVGAAGVGLAGLSAVDRVRMTQELEVQKQEEQQVVEQDFLGFMDFMNREQELVRQLLVKHKML